jgi:hypothetical protein
MTLVPINVEFTSSVRTAGLERSLIFRWAILVFVHVILGSASGRRRVVPKLP